MHVLLLLVESSMDLVNVHKIKKHTCISRTIIFISSDVSVFVIVDRVSAGLDIRLDDETRLYFLTWCLIVDPKYVLLIFREKIGKSKGGGESDNYLLPKIVTFWGSFFVAYFDEQKVIDINEKLL